MKGRLVLGGLALVILFILTSYTIRFFTGDNGKERKVPLSVPRPSEFSAGEMEATMPPFPEALSRGQGPPGTGFPRTLLPELPPDSRFIQTARVDLQVRNGVQASKAMVEIAKKYSGLIVKAEVMPPQGVPRAGVMVLLVLSDYFDEMMESINALGMAESVNVDSQDISEEYAQLRSRRENLTVMRERFLSIVGGSGPDIQGSVEVKTELKLLNEHIERIESRLATLNSMMDKSTVTVNYRERGFTPP